MMHRREEQVLAAQLENNQSTHGDIVSNSVGMGILVLLNNYKNDFGDEKNAAKIETEYKKFAKDLENLVTTPKAEAPVNQDLVSAMRHISEQVAAPVDQLDKLTLYRRKDAMSPYADDIRIFSLKLVITLVWKALRHHEKFAALPKGQKEIMQARGDYNHRLQSFYNCLLQFNKKRDLCHTGIRHELMFLLNKTYEGLDFIESANATIFATVRDELNKRIHNNLEIASDPAKKITMRIEILKWLKTKNAAPLMPIVDPEDEIRKNLHELIRHHGSNPVKEELDKKIDDCLPGIYFDSDGGKYKVLESVVNIYDLHTDSDKQEFKVVNLWLENQFELGNKEHEAFIQQFLIISRAILKIESAQFISLTRRQNFKELLHRINIHFDLVKEQGFTLNEALAAEAFSAWQQVKELQNSLQVDEVTNFFVKWFSQEDKQLKSSLYKMLMQNSDQIMFKDDNEVSEFIEQLANVGDTGEREVSFYEINRVILHAIIVSPQNWTSSFDSLLESMLELLIKIHHDERSAPDGRRNVKDNYPITPLLYQLNYLHHEYIYLQSDDNSITRPQRHCDGIVMPWNIRSIVDWFSIVDYLNDDKTHEEIYQTYRVHINWLLINGLADHAIDLGMALNSLPKNAYKSFLNENVKTIADFKRLVGETELERQQFVLKQLSCFTELLKTLENFADFKEFVTCLEGPVTHLAILTNLDETNIDFKTILKGSTILDFNIFIYNISGVDHNRCVARLIGSSTNLKSILDEMTTKDQSYLLTSALGYKGLATIVTTIVDFDLILNAVKSEIYSQAKSYLVVFFVKYLKEFVGKISITELIKFVDDHSDDAVKDKIKQLLHNCESLIDFIYLCPDDENYRYSFMVDIIGAKTLLDLVTFPNDLRQLIYSLPRERQFEFFKEVFLDHIIKNNFFQEFIRTGITPFKVGNILSMTQDLEYQYQLTSVTTIFSNVDINKDKHRLIPVLRAMLGHLYEIRIPEHVINIGIQSVSKKAEDLSIILLCHRSSVQKSFFDSIDKNFIHALIKTPKDFQTIDKTFDNLEVRKRFRKVYFGEPELGKFVKIYMALHAGQSGFFKTDRVAGKDIGSFLHAQYELVEILKYIARNKSSRTAEAWRLMLAHNADNNDMALLNNVYVYSFNRSGFFKVSGVKKSLNQPSLIDTQGQQINLFAEFKPGTRRDKINKILQPALRGMQR